MALSFASPITAVAGIGPKKASAFEALDIYNVYDLLHHFPRAYQNRGDAKTLMEAASLGEKCAMILTVGTQPQTVMLKNRRTITKFTAFDETGRCTVTFFNQNYVKTVFNVGDAFRFFGKVERFHSTWQISSPDFEPINSLRPLADLYPIYPLTYGISQKVMQNIIGTALASLDKIPDEPIPEEVRRRAGICSFREALFSIHRPASVGELSRARDYFIFEELFLFAAGVLSSKKQASVQSAPRLRADKALMDPFFAALPFTLTGAQMRTVRDIARDLMKDTPMHRLVQGDVGSGKTVCAAAAAYICAKNGYQCAIMAPTEILARQHFADLSKLFEKLSVNCTLLVGSMSASSKRAVHKSCAEGATEVVIGTHALLSEGVHFRSLGLIVTDEQHRFGIGQRSSLAGKAGEPSVLSAHSLAMSATPIPRTLALAMLSDIEVSVIDELPPGRRKVSTFLVDESYRQRLEGFICKQSLEGRQTYVVCPAIENSGDEDEDCDLLSLDGTLISRKEELRLKSAVDYYTDFSTRFPNISTAYLHGKMSGKEKDRVMKEFAEGKISVLVSTTVIEVGVNVPNATLMVIENAERFGLSQLHQLRGRVGRGEFKSWCILVSDSQKDETRERLDALCKTSNGFEIAQTDLRLRGPGDFFATLGRERQHGKLRFRFASLCDNSETLNKAFEEAALILEKDPCLEAPDNACLADALAGIMANNLS